MRISIDGFTFPIDAPDDQENTSVEIDFFLNDDGDVVIQTDTQTIVIGGKEFLLVAKALVVGSLAFKD